MKEIAIYGKGGIGKSTISAKSGLCRPRYFNDL